VGCICFVYHTQQHHSLEHSQTLTPTLSNSHQDSCLPLPPTRKRTRLHYNNHPLQAATITTRSNRHREQQPPLQHHATRWRARSGKVMRIDNNHLLDARKKEIMTGDAQRQQPPHFPSFTLPSFPLREPFFHSSHYERLLISGG